MHGTNIIERYYYMFLALQYEVIMLYFHMIPIHQTPEASC